MGSIYLHPTVAADFEDYYTVRSDPGDVYWNGYASAPEKESFRRGFLVRTAGARFEVPEDRRNYLIKETRTNDTAGFIQLIRRESAVEVGYSVMEEYQRRGYASEALRQAVALASEFGLPIIVRIRDDNIASQSVAGKNGFCATAEYVEKDYYGAGTVKLRTYVLKQG